MAPGTYSGESHSRNRHEIPPNLVQSPWKTEPTATAKNGGMTKATAAPVPAASSSSGGRKRQRWQAPHCNNNISTLLPILLHLISVGTYLRPLTSSPSLLTNPSAVLDEAHIVSGNPDVAGTSTLRDVFVNDYWGRPITNNPSTHKSWRPLTILSFRWMNGGGILGWSPLFVHRIVNVLIHAAAAETCSIAATLLFPDLDSTHTTVLRAMTKLLFALHPAHVEVVANAANRPHILAVLLSSLMLDPANRLIVVIMAEIGGLLCSETAIFQLPGVLATLTVIKWKRDYARKTERNWTSFFFTMARLIPRYATIIFFGLVYLGGRKYFDTLSIPDGLIRPAENPFYSLTGKTRMLTYALLLAIHTGKAVLIDPIGFSHEYGFECIRNVVDMSDARLLAPLAIYIGIGLVTLLCCRRGAEATVMWAVALAWLLTLFPVSGAIKVGTSIADRIVVPTTFAFAIFGGRLLTALLLNIGNDKSDQTEQKGPTFARTRSGITTAATSPQLVARVALVSLLFGSMYKRVHRRSLEWTDSLSLLESSLISCPRSAKSNLEISKIYSGLYKEKFDLPKAM